MTREQQFGGGMVHSSRAAIGRRVQISESGSMHESYSSLKSFVYGEYIYFAKASQAATAFYLSKSAFYGLLCTDLLDLGLLVAADAVI